MTSVPEPEQPMQLDEAQISVGEALLWPLLDKQGRLLLRAGTVVATDEERQLLLKHFVFYAGAAQAGAVEGAGSPDAAHARIALADMQLSIGSPVGFRSARSTSGPMQRSRLIGISPNRAMFVTAPSGKQPLALSASENVNVVAIGSHAVFSFSCTVLAVCNQPFGYLVLSEPGNVRILRARKAMRVPTRLAVRYRTDPADGSPDSLGLGRDLSVSGMSLVCARPIGEVGTRVHIAFPIGAAQSDKEFEAPAVVRNVNDGSDTDGSIEHGLEFENVSAEQQFALRSFLFDYLNSGQR